MKNLIRKDILYPELSYQIIGILFEISNKFGNKYQERYYQRAISTLLGTAGIKFKEQVPVKLTLENKPIATGFIDFLLEDKIILEIKRGERFLRQNISQLYSYLKITNMKLGILANFTSRGLQFKRVVNIHS
jgi:GxxExxY protein